MAGSEINAATRTGNTKGYLQELRRQGKIPAVLYGKGVSNEAIELNVKELETIFRKKGRNALINLVVSGGKGDSKYTVMVKEVQKDPLRGEIIHADLCSVSLEDKMHATAPVSLRGEAQGLKNGGIIQMGVREVEVECIPANIPEAVTLDITGLDIGDKLTVGEIPQPAEYKIITDPETVIVTIVAPRTAEETETTEEVAETAPEQGPKTPEDAQGEE